MAADSLPANYDSRRKFLRNSVAATLATAVSSALSAARVVGTEAAPAPPVKDFELDEITIDGLQKAFQSGQYSSRSVTEEYLSRIREIDKAGPMINSIIEISPDAIQIAEALDQERKSHGARGPLHGVPILIKDNIDTADRMHTTAGSLALMESRPASDAFRRRAIAQRWSGNSRKNKSQRMGQHSLQPFNQWMERARWADS